ncbi:MAG: S49 family peptidase [Alphaproteobacteria bacterium]|nr:MAG: S49 family peptidase [Alphaproteobacteria bacterium]
MISLFRKSGPLVPVLRFGGPIGMATPLRPGVTLATTATAIQKAFEMKRAQAVAIQVNSPGGSPVQSMLIYNRIRALAAEKNLPVYVFAEDVAASGGYLIALAGDEIYADPSSVVGSIGVVSAGFGFHKLIEKIGVERRVYTSGERKVMLDPFQPEKEDDVERLRSLQQDVHETFIDLVKERRGRRIERAGDALFTGEFWSGRRAMELGLVDGLSDLRTKMREMLGERVRFKLVQPERGLFRRRVPGVFNRLAGPSGHDGFGAPGFADELLSAIEARALWSRYGL